MIGVFPKKSDLTYEKIKTSIPECMFEASGQFVLIHLMTSPEENTVTERITILKLPPSAGVVTGINTWCP